MTPMMFPSGAATAAPGGAISTGNPLTGASQAAPGGLPVSDDGAGFDAFNVALLAILEQAALSETDGQPSADGGEDQGEDAGQRPAGADVAFRALWLQSIARKAPAADGPTAGEIAGVPTSGNSADASKTDEDAAIVAALACATTPISQVAAVPQWAIPTAGAPATDVSGTHDEPPAGGLPAQAADPAAQADGKASATAGWATRAPGTVEQRDALAGSISNAPAAQDATQAGAATAEELASETKGPADAKAGMERENVGPRNTSETQGAERRTATYLNARAARAVAIQAPPVSPTPETGAGSTTLLSEAAAVSASTENSTTANATTPGIRTEAQRLIADAVAANGQAVQDAQADTSSGNSSRDRGREERRASFEMTWLRRSSSLESRLAPPASFVMPSATPTTPGGSAAAAFGSTVQAPFEMPAAAENLSRLVQTIRVQARDGVSHATVRLNPEHLGEVTMTIRVESGNVTAVVRAEAGDVRQWLRGQEESIRASLAEQGLTLDELVVEQDGQGRQHRDEEHEQESRRNRARGRRVSASSFEVTA